jgi:hypothetical protein
MKTKPAIIFAIGVIIGILYVPIISLGLSACNQIWPSIYVVGKGWNISFCTLPLEAILFMPFEMMFYIIKNHLLKNEIIAWIIVDILCGILFGLLFLGIQKIRLFLSIKNNK